MTGFALDWKNKSLYPDPVNMTPRLWAWEFLRRNNQYQTLWDASLDRDGNVVPATFPEFQERFWVKFPMNPSGKSAPHFKFDTIKVCRHSFPFNAKCKPDLPKELAKTEALVIFDLSLKLDFQLDLAKQRLENIQFLLNRAKYINTLRHRNRFEHYPTYLRVLDARKSGAKFKTIGALLYPALNSGDPEKAYERAQVHFRAAEILRDGDYRLIAIGPKKKRK